MNNRIRIILGLAVPNNLRKDYKGYVMPILTDMYTKDQRVSLGNTALHLEVARRLAVKVDVN
jgi:hypothetical protein